MLPTFEVVGDVVLIQKSYRRGRGIKVGDVVNFDSVVRPDERVIKRVVGLEGDYVLRDTPGTGESMIQVCPRFRTSCLFSFSSLFSYVSI